MTQEEFKKILEENDYYYKEEGNRIEINHRGYVDLGSLTTLPEGIVFSNGGYVNLGSLFGGWFSTWKGNIKDIDSKRLLNKMISLGLFNRK